MDSILETLGLEALPETRVVTGIITAATPDVATVTTRDGSSALLPSSEFYPGQPLEVGRQYYLLRIPGPAPMLSVVRPELISALYAGVTPELRTGIVRIISIARAPGSRSKVAVASTRADVDPVSALVGRNANRVRAISALLGGERIDVIPYHRVPETYLANALAPATVERVVIDGDSATVYAPSHQMSAAVGHGGLNSQLAGQLLGVSVRVAAA